MSAEIERLKAENTALKMAIVEFQAQARGRVTDRCPAPLAEVLCLRFPDRVLERGLITFLGPFSDEEVNQACIETGRRPARKHKGPFYRDGTYYALVDLRASYSELMEIFTEVHGDS
jgi:hypothetical protein